MNQICPPGINDDLCCFLYLSIYLSMDISLLWQVTGVERRDSVWRVATTAGQLLARLVINCGGNHADTVEELRTKVSNIQEEKAKVVATVWGTELIEFHAAL